MKAKLADNSCKLQKMLALRRSLMSCFLLYVTIYVQPIWTSSDQVTDTSVNKTPGQADTTVNETTDTSVNKTPGQKVQRPEYRDHCIMSRPTGHDIATLCHNRSCGVVRCVRSCDSTNASSVRTSCFSKTCSHFTGEIAGQDISGRSLVKFVNVSLHRLARAFRDVNKSYMGKSPCTRNYGTVHCTDVNSVMFDQEFLVEISDYLDSCNAESIEEPGKFRDVSENSTTNIHMNIHLVYFRALSRWESYFKLPNFHSFTEHMKLDSAWSVHTFDRVQSQDVSLESNLVSLLGGLLNSAENENSTETAFDLLSHAATNGRCIQFKALGSRDIKVYETIRGKISALANQTECTLTNSNSDTSIYSLTRSRNEAGDFDLDNTLVVNDFLNDAILSQESNPATKIFSISAIDFADLPQASDLDSSLTRALHKVMSRLSDVFIFMSDVGDPKFSRFDNNVFLRLQTFNPLLNVFIPRTNMSDFYISPLQHQEAKTLYPRIENREISQQKIGSIGFSDIRNLLTTLLESGPAPGENNTGNSSFPEINTSLDDQDRADIPGDLRLARNVFGPVESVCQGNRVHFPNDTIQAAFASIVIGRINDKLQDLSRYSNKDNTHRDGNIVRFCNRLLGIKFQNVMHVMWKDTTYILMTLQIGMKQGQGILRNLLILETEIEYSVVESKTMNISIHFLTPRKVNLDEMFGVKSSLTEKLIHSRCSHVDGGRDDDLRDPPTLTRSHLTYFGVPSTQKSLHHPCLFLEMTSFPDSSVIEAVNHCRDVTYNLTVGAELVNTISLTSLPAVVTVRPFETRYVSTFVKSFYGAPMSAYKLTPVFHVIDH